MVNATEPYCSIPLFYDAMSGIYETSYSDSVVLSRVEETCGCTMHLESRPYKGTGTAVIIASHGLNKDESDALKVYGQSPRVGLFHLSDESPHGNNDNSYYPNLAFVYRNYDLDSAAMTTPLRYMYLGDAGANSNKTAEEEAQAGHVFWYPLGPANNFIPTRAFVQPSKLRLHLWAWIGCMEEAKRERHEMLSALRSHAQTAHLFEIGNFLDSKTFGNNVLMLNDYMRPYYTARFVPCPSGQNPEQFRIWEALEAGAIPIVLRRHLDKWLKFVPLLGLQVAVIDSWNDLPAFLLRAEAMGDWELAQWQSALYTHWLRIKQRMVDSMAASICALKPYALVHHHVAAPLAAPLAAPPNRTTGPAPPPGKLAATTTSAPGGKVLVNNSLQHTGGNVARQRRRRWL